MVDWTAERQVQLWSTLPSSGVVILDSSLQACGCQTCHQYVSEEYRRKWHTLLSKYHFRCLAWFLSQTSDSTMQPSFFFFFFKLHNIKLAVLLQGELHWLRTCCYNTSQVWYSHSYMDYILHGMWWSVYHSFTGGPAPVWQDSGITTPTQKIQPLGQDLFAHTHASLQIAIGAAGEGKHVNKSV